MSEQRQPHWDCLPHDPTAFFGLPAEFDLRDLKRSYNQLVRQFKPEKFPQEFQRIRAAYESLNDALRYDLPRRSAWPIERATAEPPTREVDVPRDELSIAEPTTAGAQAATPALSLSERLLTAPPRVLYQELKGKEHKTADDFISLALLSDVQTDSPLPGELFVDWLLAGIAAQPHDWKLTQLFREFLADQVPTDQLPALLQRAVEILPADRFQYTTERAWDRLLREGGFDEFRDCLQRCGTRLGRSVDHSQLVFYVHVLKLAMWKADDAFINELKDTVDDHFHDLDGWVESEYEMVLALLEYRAQREAFVRRGPCCQRIDQAIRDWCLLPEYAGDLSVLDCQYFLSMRGRKLLEELPDHQENLVFVLRPWNRIVDDVLDRLAAPEPPSEELLAERTRSFLIRVMQRSRRTFEYFYGLGLVLLTLCIFLLALVTSGSLAIRTLWKWFGQGLLLSGLLDAVLACVVLVGGLIAGVVIFYIGRRTSIFKYASVRPGLLNLLRVAPVHVEQLAPIILAREDEKFGDDQTIDDTKVIASPMVRDAAVEFFSLAQVCLHAAVPEPVIEATIMEDVVVEPIVLPPSKPRPQRIR